MAPDVFASARFAMKGGTAINVFVQDMPRLSVDTRTAEIRFRGQHHATTPCCWTELSV